MGAMKAAKAMKARKAKRVSTIQGPLREGARVPWKQGEDRRQPQQGVAHEEQARQDRVEARQRTRQAGLQAGQELDPRFIKARKELGVKGFVALGGNTQQGKALYKKTKEIHATLR